jgi:sortase (surface protein transpeptidase)
MVLICGAVGLFVAERRPRSNPPVRPPAVAGLDGNAPARVEIPAISVTAAVEPLGLKPDGHVQVPGAFDRIGWYAGGPPPGEPGPAVLLGHVDSYTGPAVFYDLPRLRPGDEVVVTRVDGAVVRFRIDRLAEYRKSRFPTGVVYGRSSDSALRLVTCAGARHGRYLDNLVVFATREA